LLRKKPGSLNDDSAPAGDLLTVDRISIAPDKKSMVAEVYPALPSGLGRAQSRLQIFNFVKRVDSKEGEVRPATPEERDQMKWFLSEVVVSPFIAPGRNIPLKTNLIQANPMWSPTGDWIAFTGLDTVRENVLPYVVRPDGTGLTPVMQPLEKVAPTFASTSWGKPHITALEWSAEGKYLWLQDGVTHDAFPWLAQQQQGKWTATDVHIELQSRAPVLMCSFNEARIAWIESAAAEKGPRVHVSDAAGEKTSQWFFNRGVEILGMDW
jgi:hypothetical protein